MTEHKPEIPTGSDFLGALLLGFALLSIISVFVDSSATLGARLIFALFTIWASVGSIRCFFPVASERFWHSMGMRLTLGRTMWGVTLAVLAAMWIAGAVSPSPNDKPYLFAVIGISATVGSGFCLFPKASERFWKAIGIGIKWTWILGMIGAAVAGIISIVAGAPIPAAIIFGALIIATAIRQSENR